MTASILEYTRSNMLFLIGLLLGGFVVYRYLREKFDEPTLPRDDGDPVSIIAPRFLATHTQYANALLLYILLAEMIFISLSILGPSAFPGVENVPGASQSFPIWVALVLTGVMPIVPWLKDLELKLRRWAHERAYIPNGARQMANSMMAADFDFSSYNDAIVLRDPLFGGTVAPSDFCRPRRSISYRWARLSCLLFRIQEFYMDRSGNEYLNEELFEAYKPEFDRLMSDYQTIRERIVACKAADGFDDVLVDRNLEISLIKLQERVYVLTGCAVRLKQSSEDGIRNALAYLGFMMQGRYDNRMDWDLYVKVIPLTAVLVLLIVVGTQIVADLFGKELSERFPREPGDAFRYASNVLIVYGAAIITTAWIHTKWMKDGATSRMDEAAQMPAKWYFFVFLLSGIAGHLANILHGVCYDHVSIQDLPNFQSELLPFAILPAITGFLVAHGLNIAALGWRQRWIDAITQGLFTGLARFILAWWELKSGSGTGIENHLSQHLGWVIFVTLTATVAGATIGFFLPFDYRQKKARAIDPMQSECLLLVTRKALGVFHEPAATQAWLTKPIAALGDRTPLKLAETIQGMEQVLSLLAELPREPHTHSG